MGEVPLTSANAKIMVRQPTRPKYISPLRINWDHILKSGVIPVEIPTVPMAEATSNAVSFSGVLSIQQIAIIALIISVI